MINGTPRHSQCQGSVERCNKDVETMMWTWIEKNGKPAPYQCSSCNHSFKTKPELASHIDTDHKKRKGHNCLDCLKNFKEKKLLESHTESDHKKKIFKCEQCNNKNMVEEEPKPKPWWSGALRLIQYVKNARLHTVLGMSPYKALYGIVAKLGTQCLDLGEDVLRGGEYEETLEKMFQGTFDGSDKNPTDEADDPMETDNPSDTENEIPEITKLHSAALGDTENPKDNGNEIEKLQNNIDNDATKDDIENGNESPINNSVDNFDFLDESDNNNSMETIANENSIENIENENPTNDSSNRNEIGSCITCSIDFKNEDNFIVSCIDCKFPNHSHCITDDICGVCKLQQNIKNIRKQAVLKQQIGCDKMVEKSCKRIQPASVETL